MRYQNAVISQRYGGYLQIVRADGCAFAREAGAKFAAKPGGFSRKRQAGQPFPQCQQMVAVFINSAAFAYTEPQLGFNRRANQEFRTPRAADALHNAGVILHKCDHHIGVEQISHQSSSRRVLSVPRSSSVMSSGKSSPKVPATTARKLSVSSARAAALPA